MPGSNKGFSLIELMIVVGLSAVILGAIYALYSQGSFAWQATDVNVEVTQDARKAMSTVAKELANSRDSNCTISTTLSANDTVAFQMPSISNSTGNITWGGDEISYYRGGSNNRQLIRTETGFSNRVVCNNLVNISFSKGSTAAGTAVNIDLQTSKATARGNTLSANLTQKVKLRNQ